MKSTTFLAIGLSALLQLSAAQGTATSPAASTDPAKVQSCYDTYQSCRIAAGQNLNPCQTALQTCLGYNPFDSPPAPAATSDAGRVQACYDQYKPCRIADNADQNVCAAQLKQCLGYNPFGDSTATSPAPSTTAAPPAATSDAARQQTCHDKYKECRIAANADLSACGSQLNACLGYNAFGSTSAAVTPATTVPEATSKTATASPTKYTGAAAKIQVEDVLFLAALGLAAV